jgi:hypothetical protein
LPHRGLSALPAMELLVTIQVDESKVVVAILPALVPGLSVVDVKLFIAEERGPAPQAASLLTAGELLEVWGEKPDFCLLPPLPVLPQRWVIRGCPAFD